MHCYVRTLAKTVTIWDKKFSINTDYALMCRENGVDIIIVITGIQRSGIPLHWCAIGESAGHQLWSAE